LVIFSIGLLASPQAFADWDKFSYPQIQGTVPVSSMFDIMSIQSFVDQVTEQDVGDPTTTKKFFGQRGFDLDAPMGSVSFTKFDREAATDETGFINPMGTDYVKQGDVQIGVEDDIITIERYTHRQLSIYVPDVTVWKDTGVSKRTIEEGKPIYMTGAELYESTVSDYTEQKNRIAISVVMAVAENSVSDGKAVYAKLADVNGFLVHEVILITEDRGYYKVLVDAGNGEALYVSAVESEEEIKKIVDRLYEMFKGYLPLTLEEKKQKLHEYIQSLN
jgi:hypothetical protein